MSMRSPRIPLLLLTSLVSSLAVTFGVSPGNDTPRSSDYVAFKIIDDRNIFNSNRSRRSGVGSTTDEAKPARVDSFTLVGTLTYAKGPYAFFDGSSAEYRKVLEPVQSIADQKVLAVFGSSITLQSGTNSVELRVGMQMRREEEGPWQPVGEGSSASAPGDKVTSASPASESSADESDLVKRLMQQREQELK